MSKPSWNDAPEWAMYLAKDENGVWTWFEHEPRQSDGGWWYSFLGRMEEVCDEGDWKASLEKRP